MSYTVKLRKTFTIEVSRMSKHGALIKVTHVDAKKKKIVEKFNVMPDDVITVGYNLELPFVGSWEKVSK